MTRAAWVMVLALSVSALTACGSGDACDTAGSGGVMFHDDVGGRGGTGGMDCRAPLNQALFQDGSPWPCRHDCYQTCPNTGGVCYATCPPSTPDSPCRPLTCDDYPKMGTAILSDGCGGVIHCQ